MPVDDAAVDFEGHTALAFVGFAAESVASCPASCETVITLGVGRSTGAEARAASVRGSGRLHAGNSVALAVEGRPAFACVELRCAGFVVRPPRRCAWERAGDAWHVGTFLSVPDARPRANASGSDADAPSRGALAALSWERPVLPRLELRARVAALGALGARVAAESRLGDVADTLVALVTCVALLAALLRAWWWARGAPRRGTGGRRRGLLKAGAAQAPRCSSGDAERDGGHAANEDAATSDVDDADSDDARASLSDNGVPPQPAAGQRAPRRAPLRAVQVAPARTTSSTPRTRSGSRREPDLRFDEWLGRHERELRSPVQ